MKRILSLLLALLMLALPLASCGGGDETTTTAATTTTAPTVTTQPPLPTPVPVEKAQTLAKKLLDMGFIFVGGSNASSNVESAAGVVINAAKEVAASKWDVVVSDDFHAREAGKKEVQMGNINRTEASGAYATLTANRVNSSRDWRITVSADTVTVIAGSNEALVTALGYFAQMMKADANLYYPSYDTGIQRHVWDATQLGGVPVEQYRIVQAAGADEATQDVAKQLQQNVFKRTGFTLPIVDDTTAPAAYELVVGKTARPVSASAESALRQGRKNCAYDSIVYASERQIAITGGAQDAIVASVDYFTRDFVEESKQQNAYNANALYQKSGIKSLSFGGNDAGDYRIVYAKNAAYDLRVTAWTLQKLLYEKFGYLIDIVTDETPAVAGQKELLLGATNRPASTTQQLEKYNAKVDANGNAVFDAGHYIGVQRMYNAFLTELDSQTGDALTVNLGYTGMVADIALSWYADKNISFTVEGRQDASNHALSRPVDRTYKNGDILKGFDFSDDYVLTWNDEFNGTSLNYEKWTHTTAIYASDMRYSTEAPYVVVKDGKVTLTAVVEGEAGAYTYRSSYSTTTVDTMNFSGGYIELRAKVPFGGNGEFPSFWLRSTGPLGIQEYRKEHNGQTYNCPYTIEIDIFENFSKKDQLSTNLIKWFPADAVDDWGWGWSGGVMTGSAAGENKVAGQGQRQYYFKENELDAYHSYGFLWTDDLVAFAVDGKFYWSCPLEYTDIGDSSWDTFNPTVTITDPNSPYGAQGETVTFGMEGFKRDNMALFVLMDNFLYTEGLYGEGIRDHSKDDEVFPIKYTLDYVRLYQCAQDRIYTRSVYDDGEKLYDPNKWEYANKGTGTPRA